MKKTGMLSFRSRRQHAKCSKCEMHKKKLRQANVWPAERELEMEEYSTHLVEQWLDRQVYDHFQEMSMSCTRALFNLLKLPSQSLAIVRKYRYRCTQTGKGVGLGR